MFDKNYLQMPKEWVEWIKLELGGKGVPKQAILHANPANFILTVRFLPPNLNIVKVEFTHRDKPGVIEKITKCLDEEFHALFI